VSQLQNAVVGCTYNILIGVGKASARAEYTGNFCLIFQMRLPCLYELTFHPPFSTILNMGDNNEIDGHIETIDPDYGLELRPEVEQELLESIESAKQGKLIPVEDVAKELGLTWE
jgi:hypothetical protein